MRFWAEVSSNHNRDLSRCLAFVDVAAAIGCDGVKLQLFRIDEIFAPEILARSAEHRRRRDWELPVEYLPSIAERCRRAGLDFVCTPFDLLAVDALVPHVDRLKVSSYELSWEPLLRACARTGKPLTLSTGMATLAEVDRAVRVVREEGIEDLTLLHCVSSYPVPAADCNLAAIGTLKERFGCPVGWSDHSVEPGVIHRAVHRWDATVVELHLDLDGRGEEFGGGHCWLPRDLEAVISAVRAGLGADGSGDKVAQPSEQADRPWRADPGDGLRPLRSERERFVRAVDGDRPD